MAPVDGVPAEQLRLEEDARREKNWKRWGPYLSERQWGTVREDYSADGDCWSYFPHEQARSRAYRWGEDGLLGFTDRECRLCFALSLWNGRDGILKERLFGLTGPEGNHGEDVKEHYFYLDSTPTHSYAAALYKYPKAEFPYAELVAENARRTRYDPEYEIADTGVFDDGAGGYWDVLAEYAKDGPDDLCIRITVTSRGPERRALHVLPTLWYRNTWSWGATHEGAGALGELGQETEGAAGPGASSVLCDHPSLGVFRFRAGPDPRTGNAPRLVFTENETNFEALFESASRTPYVKDAFHRLVIEGREDAVNPERRGTKAAALYVVELDPGASATIRLRLTSSQEPAFAGGPETLGPDFERVFERRRREADEFFAFKGLGALEGDRAPVVRQAFAGLLWSKQFYHYSVRHWLDGDPAQPAPPSQRRGGRNADWTHLFHRDVLSMPDKWEYPWYAAWDLAFHMVPLAHIDPAFAKEQLLLLLREWYMHPSGQLPAYEFAFSDVNPPVHAWAVWEVYEQSGPPGKRDRAFLARAFQKLLINFTWWVNRKDPSGKHLFSGGFLGLDNIGVFDRSRPLPTGGQLVQADATAWMAFYCGTMLAISLELAREDPTYEDVASKFFEHFVAITDAMNSLGGAGLWDENDGFYYDQIMTDAGPIPLKLRSLVGIIPILASIVLTDAIIDRLPGFKKRMEWFILHREDLARSIAYMARESDCGPGAGHDDPGERRLLAIPSRERLLRVLSYLLDEREFLSPFGIRSLSRVYERKPYIFEAGDDRFSVRYVPGESDSAIFGGNSNWRGPVWFPLNFLIIEALERYHSFYGSSLQVEFPTGSGRRLTLAEVALELRGRLINLFLPDASGRRPCHGADERFAK
ncbi:MAG: glucosidase, partial [Planctomycetota bacterium]|nr:glucosidase [Planctomycetota bacterium]